MNFQCTECGACCRRAYKLGMPVKKDGSCIYLNDENRCDIYETRPAICSVDKTYNAAKKQGLVSPNLTRKEFYIINNKECNRMIIKDKLNKKYLIDLEKYDKMSEM
jgi:Fe-S-cluster containining protein